MIVAPACRDEVSYTLTYICDGTDHPKPLPVPPVPPASQPQAPAGATMSVLSYADETYRAIWTRDQLVIMSRSVTKIDPPPANLIPAHRVTRKAYSIDKDGLLNVETLTVVDPSMNGPTQASPVPTRQVYRKIS